MHRPIIAVTICPSSHGVARARTSPTRRNSACAMVAVVFAIGAWRGPRQHPYGLIFRRLVAPRLGPVTEKEPAPRLKFAQLVGFVFAVVGVIGFAGGAPLLGLIATGFALVAAFLNAAFGICLGCQIYPLVARVRKSSSAPSPA